MTMIVEDNERCMVCGKTSSQPVIMSTNAFGSADLDGRPPEMMRSAMVYTIHRCPSCGYCSPKLSDGPQQAIQIVSSAPYLQQLNDSSFPKLATEFLCWGMIMELVGDQKTCVTVYLQAAWMCDDAENNLAAIACREKAIRILQAVLASGTQLFVDDGYDELRLADMLRRCGRFTEAVAACQQGLLKRIPKMVRHWLQFEVKLAEAGDAACHNLSEVPAGSNIGFS